MEPTDPHGILHPPRFVIVAEGTTDSARNHARGHLFERFIAGVLAKMGCEDPQSRNINVSDRGIELDLELRRRIGREPVVAECKALKSPIDAPTVKNFYGALSGYRLMHSAPSAWGILIAIPDLNGKAWEWMRGVMARDDQVVVQNAIDVYRTLISASMLRKPPAEQWPTSDEAILITRSGLYGAHKVLNPSTSLPVFVRTWSHQVGMTCMPPETIGALRADPYCDQLEIEQTSDGAPSAPSATTDHEPILVHVKGGDAAAEYQFPASPKHFVGRRSVLDSLLETVAGPSASVIVLNAQSGWGKSSLALKLATEVETVGGAAVVLDSRTATTRRYCWASVSKLISRAASLGILDPPPERSYGSLASSLDTLERCTLLTDDAHLLIFFDQFENVFRSRSLTEEFRNFALSLRQLKSPLTLGFAWKTDLVGFTENHPYDLRDDIRNGAKVFELGPFGPDEASQLMSRMAKEQSVAVSRDLRRRVQEYSQGLPWLLKKLTAHVISEFARGVSEDELLSASMNVSHLFEREKARLSLAEQSALVQIARDAPVRAHDILEVSGVDAAVIQSLLDQRLVVQVGERLDVYWDVFRDFLNTGTVAIEETFILRTRPTYDARLLRELYQSGGGTASELAARLSSTVKVVWNAAKELRALGIVRTVDGCITLVDALPNTLPPKDFERALRSRVALTLRRSRAYSIVSQLIATTGNASLDQLTKELPNAFPAVEAKASTWRTYAQAFADWFDYAELAGRDGDTLREFSGESKYEFMSTSARRVRTFPKGYPEPTIRYARWLCGIANEHGLTAAAYAKAESNMKALGLPAKTIASPDDVEALRALFSSEGNRIVPSRLRELLQENDAAAAALELLAAVPTATAKQIGNAIADTLGETYREATLLTLGKEMRAWARLAGVGDGANN